jgi:hypothetical protein
MKWRQHLYSVLVLGFCLAPVRGGVWALDGNPTVRIRCAEGMNGLGC